MAEDKRPSDKRSPRYVERFTRFVVTLAAIAGIIVLTDFSMVLPMWDGAFIKFGGAAFSADLKGMVVGVLVAAVIQSTLKFWFPGSEVPPPPSSSPSSTTTTSTTEVKS